MEKQEKQTNEKQSKKVLKVVALRNRFFYMFYRNISLVFMVSIITFICSIFFLIQFIKQPIAPQYIPLNEDGTYIRLTPLSEPKTDLEVNNFVNSALKKLFKFDYVNYSEQLMEAANYFVAQNWNEYLEAYTKSGGLIFVKNNKCVVTIKVLEAPVIIKKGVNPNTNVYEWDIQTKVQISYFGQSVGSQPGANKVDILYALIRVSRNSVINNSEGLGITKVVFTNNI